LNIDDNLPDVHYNIANAYSLLGKTTTAIPHYLKSIKLKPGKSETFYNLGNAYCVIKNYEEAISAFKKAI
jgi:tetratricopeptide (TPR) repeat protein